MDSRFRIRASLCTLFALASAFIPTAEGSDSASRSIELVSNHGFCVNGVWSGAHWPGKRPDGLKTWGSFCGKGDANVGRAESQDFTAPSVLNVYLVGYPGTPGVRLMLKNVESKEERELRPQSVGEEWRLNALPVPSEWVDERVQFIAEDKATGPGGWMGFSLPVLPADLIALPTIDKRTLPKGYCQDGVYDATEWPDHVRPKGVTIWGSFCASGDKNGNTGWGASQPIAAGSYINFYIAGYPDGPGLTLAVENVKTGELLFLHPSPPAEKWELGHFRLPAEWKGQPVRVISRDQATGPGGWAGFSEPLPTTLADEVVDAAKTFRLVVLLAFALLIPSAAVCMLAVRRGVGNLLYLAATALLILGITFGIYFYSPSWDPAGLVSIWAGLLAASAVLLCFSIGKRRGLKLPRVSVGGYPPGPVSPALGRGLKWRWLILVLTWGLAALAVLPAIYHWAAPPPLGGSERDLLIGLGYLAALVICYGIYRAESRRLTRSQAMALVYAVFLLTGIYNNIHSYNVDQATRYFAEPNRVWQKGMHESVVRLAPGGLPHSYRFLPDSIVRWMELAGLSFEPARDVYRLIVGLLLFYAIYKYARLYCNYTGALIAMLFVTAIYPISFEYYAGQLIDPLSHLSFVLAFIFLETEEFGLLLSTLLIGSLAKETVLAMAGYYLLFHWKERYYILKGAVLCIASGAVYLGVRLLVLHGAMHYNQASGVTLDHVWENWQNGDWQAPVLLTAGALLPFLAMGWKETALSLKRQALFLLPVLFISGLLFSWLREGRNFMPLVFVVAVVAGGYISRQLTGTRKLEAVQETSRQPEAETPLGV